MNSRLRILLLCSIMLGLLSLSGAQSQEGTGSDASAVVAADSLQPLPWLHIAVETSYGWFWQKSTGIAYTTRTRDGKERVKVGKLCIRLAAHDTTIKCVENADSVVIFEHKKGVAIPKRTAYVTAWTENPKLDTLRVEMRP